MTFCQEKERERETLKVTWARPMINLSPDVWAAGRKKKRNKKQDTNYWKEPRVEARENLHGQLTQEFDKVFFAAAKNSFLLCSLLVYSWKSKVRKCKLHFLCLFLLIFYFTRKKYFTSVKADEKILSLCYRGCCCHWCFSCLFCCCCWMRIKIKIYHQFYLVQFSRAQSTVICIKSCYFISLFQLEVMKRKNELRFAS